MPKKNRITRKKTKEKKERKKEKRVKIGIYSQNSCLGCQQRIFESEEFKELIKIVDVINFPLLNKYSQEFVDIAFLEGEFDNYYVAELKKKARYVIGLGSCKKNNDCDYNIRGCPINTKEFYDLIKKLLHGLLPEEPTHPVCIDCSLNENKCVLLENKHCAGPITIGGCGAECVTKNLCCSGCRGTISMKNLDSYNDILKKIQNTDFQNSTIYKQGKLKNV